MKPTMITNKLFFLFLFGFYLSIISCSSTNIKAPISVSDSAKIKEEVKQVILAERKAWAARNVDEATKSYADDIYWINAFGIVKHGKTDAKYFISRIFLKPGFNAATYDKAATVEDIRLLNKDVAWVHTYSETSGQLTDSGQAMANRKTHIFFILTQGKNRWLISSFQVMDEKERVQ